MSIKLPHLKALASLGVASIALAGSATAQISTGPSSSQSPYVVPVAPGVLTRSIITVGDSVNNKPNGDPYRFVGIPDGLGAFDNGNGTFTLLANHELGPTVGVERAHGAKGAFVSKWTINKSNLQVIKGEDLIQNIATWNTTTNSYNAPAKGVTLGRLCSANLPDAYAFYSPLHSAGFKGRLFLSGEETGAEGRVFAHGLDGVSYELPRLGKFSWENALAHPFSGLNTIVVGTDDSTPGQVYVYIGTKTNSGSPVDRAGLTNGQLYGIKVQGVPAEDTLNGIGGTRRFSLYPLGNVANKTGAEIQIESNAAGITNFRRPEDGHWNLSNWNQFYFVTTNGFDLPSRLWRVQFDDIFNPLAGGTITSVLNGSEGQHMLDNMAIDLNSRALLQEDPGNNPYIAKIRQYRLDNGQFSVVAQHDPNRFLLGAPNFLTQDEESSGIIDVSDILGQGWFILDVQAHYPLGGELVEGGQLLALYAPIPAGAPRYPYPGNFYPSNPTYRY